MSLDVSFIAEAEVGAVLDCLDIAFHDTSSAPVRERRAALLEVDRCVAARDRGAVVGTLAAYSLDLSVPGGTLPAAGITMASVLPTHRRRGALAGMMAALTAQARERGEPLMALWASEGGIYGRFGFGVAGWCATLRAYPRHRALAPAGGEDLALRLLPAEGAETALAAIHDRVARVRPGMPSRDARWWRWGVLHDPEDARAGDSELRVARAGDDGYALYRGRQRWDQRGADSLVLVKELMAATPAADAALWRYLGALDLVGEIEAPLRPLDDAGPLLSGDAEALRMTDVEPALWLRILDLPAAAAGRSWAADVRTVLDVTGPTIGGRWRLEAGACTATDDAPDLALGEADLAAAWLGGTPLARLAAAGRVREHTPGAVAALDAALHVPLAPWTPRIF